MSIQSRIDEEIKTAMKARETEKVGFLRTLKSALKNSAIEKGSAAIELSDADAITVIRKQAKQREDSITSFEAGGRADLVGKERLELEMLQTYLPEPLTDEELAELVQSAIAQTGATSKAQMGLVMKVAQERAQGRADGKALSSAVQKALS